MIEGFASQLDVPSIVYGLNEYAIESSQTVENILWQIGMQSYHRYRLNPGNTIVACSDWGLGELFRKASFSILPMEWISPNNVDLLRLAKTPTEVFEELYQQASRGEDWRTKKTLLTEVSSASRRVYLKYGYFDRLTSLIDDHLHTDDGDISMTRDYISYTRELDHGAATKFKRIRDFINPGLIVDIGCGDGTLLQRISTESGFADSELIGIEPSSWLKRDCVHKLSQGAFKQAKVHFYQADIAKRALFPHGTVNTFIAVSLCHEIWSYEGENALRQALALIYQQLKPGGVFIIYDVISPEESEHEIIVNLSRQDGQSDDYAAEFTETASDLLTTYLEGMSTYARFRRFAKDFTRLGGFPISFSEIIVEGQPMLKMSARCLREFIGKKDYASNWIPEMRETYSYWTFSDWIRELCQIGFDVSESSHSFCHEYLVENTLPKRVEVLKLDGTGKAIAANYPITNAVIIASKPGQNICAVLS
jgi:SAM-dependent methyltransferase